MPLGLAGLTIGNGMMPRLRTITRDSRPIGRVTRLKSEKLWVRVPPVPPTTNQNYINTMTNAFASLIQLQRELDEKLKTFGKEAFTEALAPFFEANPRVDGIVWSQYTPYFNDGDACTFGVHEPYLVSASLIEEFPEYAEEYMHENALYVSSYRTEKEEPNDATRAMQGLGPIWAGIPESVFLAVFGDHVQVLINRDGTVEVDETDHD